MTNNLILTPDQKAYFKTLQEEKIVHSYLVILNRMPVEVLPSFSTKTQGYFCLFITHALRILIMFMIIDKDSLSIEKEEEPSLMQIIRKYS